MIKLNARMDKTLKKHLFEITEPFHLLVSHTRIYIGFTLLNECPCFLY